MRIIVRLRELRKHRNMTQEELASQLNISRQSLISLEQGRWLPSLPLAIQLAAFFQAPLEEVISTTEANPSSQQSLKADKETDMPKNLNPWSPFRELREMRDEVDRVFDQSLCFPPGAATVFPTVNIRQDEANIYLEAAVPGFTQDQIDIDVADEYVTLSGHLEQEKNSGADQAAYLRREHQQQEFSRTIGLPMSVVADKAGAKLNHGVLTIVLPKVEAEKPKTKRLKPTV